MVRRRGACLLALSLVSVIALIVTLILNEVDFSALNSPFSTPKYFKFQTLNEVTLPAPVPVVDVGDNPCYRGTPVYGDYCVVSPYANKTRNTSNVGLVTLCTQGTVEFLKHVVVLCHRWSSPISVAVYSPLDDYEDSRKLVHMLRQCDSCVRYWVSWHFFFPRTVEVPAVDQFQLTNNCSSIIHGPKKRRSQGTYPINVARNLARQFAGTPFVFSSDIELYPSLNIPAKFERMIRSQTPSLGNQVWVLPVFEVQHRVRAPLLKSQLRDLFGRKQAISFHQYRCNICHKIPNLTQWMANGNGRISEVEESIEPLRIWASVKRNRQFKLQEWEPFFIGTKRDPEFDIRLSWEGKQNKMQVAYEMCIKNYNFHIIENAFLVHKPGINFYNATKEKERGKYVRENHKVFRTIKKRLTQTYGSKNSC